MRSLSTAMSLALFAVPASAASPTGAVEVFGLIIPLDARILSDDRTPSESCGFYIRTNTGEQKEVRWTADTKVALSVNTRQFAEVQDGVLHYHVHSSSEVLDFPLPKEPLTGVKLVGGGKRLQQALKEAIEEKWIPAFGLRLYFGEQLPEQLPTEDDPRFVGKFAFRGGDGVLTIQGVEYEVSLKKGGQTDALLFGVVGTEACKPFVNSAHVFGREENNVLVADEIHLEPLGDQTAGDDPSLPRYLCIGDSISGNYAAALQEALAGKVNYHHPPTNCGPSGKGRGQIHNWLGGYDARGRKWDVISFNFGHWDAGNTKEVYQANLEAIIQQLEKTGARLIWVTTCPVPDGCPPAGELQDGKAPGRTAGVMRNYLNPWALEVVKRHPQIDVCDQWQFVADRKDDLYAEWFKGDNVHFSGEPAEALGRLLADHVLKALGK